MATVRAVGLLVVVVLAGCVLGPNNGDSFAGAQVGASFTVQGDYPNPGVLVEIQVLRSPLLDPAVDANWDPTPIGSGVSSTTNAPVDGSAEYPWSVTVTPVPDWSATSLARWPAGGLLKLRARFNDRGSYYYGYTFDNATWLGCMANLYSTGTAGYTIGQKCNGVGGNVVAIVSTLQNPADLPLGRDFLSAKPLPSPLPGVPPGGTPSAADLAAETARYYATWSAPATLDAFKSTYLYPGDTGDITATYYNDTDLAIGREMHCWRKSLGIVFFTACYVSNYSDTFGTPKFGNNDLTATLANATAHNHSEFATVAMIYTGNTFTGVRGPVNFVVYGAPVQSTPGGPFVASRVNAARLDNRQYNTSIPTNCLTCHGLDASYSTATSSISGNAYFLPFAVADFQYSNQAAYTRAAQEGAFYRLNTLVRDSTQPTPGITQLVNGEYASGTTWDDSYVPSGWQVGSTQTYPTLYTGVVRQYCRGCHLSSAGSADFATAAHFDAFNNLGSTPQYTPIRDRACQSAANGFFMPQAEHPMRKFWASGARAYLNEWTQDRTGCKP
jgi:hypothetical protein